MLSLSEHKPQSNSHFQPPIHVVGAGLVGALLSMFLARRGLRVQVYERRPDMRKEQISAGRSINLAVSTRGLHALEQVGLKEQVLSIAIPMGGRMIHGVDGQLTFQRYGRDDSECIHSVSRGELNKLLLNHAECTGWVSFAFNQRVTAFDDHAGALTVRDETTGDTKQVGAPVVIGADGSASAIRAQLVERAGQCHEDVLEHGYKELSIPPGAGGAFPMAEHALHIWPRKSFMLIALPNRDGSFTCTLFLPNEGAVSFATVNTPEAVVALFREQFPDALPLMPTLAEDFFANPTGRLVTIKTWPWNAGGKALLIGDAAHAIVPFFGQGMNAGFEDCSVLDDMLGDQMGAITRETRDWARAELWEGLFRTFSAARKPDADAIADLALENFVEMRDRVAEPRFVLRKQVEHVLESTYPRLYRSRYELVTFSRVPYRVAYAVGNVQKDILDELCTGIGASSDVDLDRARHLLESKLVPLMKHHTAAL